MPPPPPLLLLLLSSSLSSSSWLTVASASPVLPVRELAYRVNDTDLELLEHVLRNEHQWRLVLKERVKGIAEPAPHAQRFPDAVPVSMSAADQADRVYDPRAVATAVVPQYAHVGSLVAYAARVVHRAAACHAMRHLSFQAHYLWLLLAGKTEPAMVLAEMSAFRGAVARVVDKLAGVPGVAELSLALGAYWDVVSLMQEDAVHLVRPKPYPPLARDVAESVFKRFQGYVWANCLRPYRPDRQLFVDAGIYVSDELLLDDVFGALMPTEELVALGRQHATFVARGFYHLGTETLPRALWTQLFYYARRLPPDEPLDRVNPFVTRQPGDQTQPGAAAAPPVVVGAVNL